MTKIPIAIEPVAKTAGGSTTGRARSLLRGVACGLLCWALAGQVLAQQPSLAEMQKLVQTANGLLQRGQDDEAAVAIEQAMQAAEKMGANSPAVGSVLMLRMGLHLKRFELDRAEASGLQAIDIFDKTLGPNLPITAMAGMSLSMVYTIWGRPALAVPWERRYLAGMEAIDRDGPSTGTALVALAHTERALGQYSFAGQHLNRAWALSNKGGAGNADDRIRIALAQAELDQLRGNTAAASAWFQRALDLRLAHRTSPRKKADQVELELARIYRGLGRFDEAEAALGRADATIDLSKPPGEYRQVPMLRERARLATARSQPDLADQALRQALAITEQVHGADNLDAAPIQTALGDALRQLAQPAPAAAAYRDTMRLLEKRFGPAHADMVPTLLGLGKAQAMTGQAEAAEASFRRALAICETLVADDHPDMAEGLEGLAPLLLAAGRDAEARAATERAALIRATAR